MAGGFRAIRGGVAGGRALARYFEASECGAAVEYYAAGEHVGVVQMTRWESAGVGRSGVTAGARVGLGKDEYARWLAGFDPVTGVARGVHRKGAVRESVLAWEHAITASKTLSVAAALDPEVAEQLTLAFDDATGAVASVVASRGVVRLGPRGGQVQVPVSAVETASVDHLSSRAGDPHRHRHLQVGARVLVEHDGEASWRAVDSRALLKGLIGEVNAAERAAICGHAGLRQVLAAKGWQLGADGEVEHFAPAAARLSKRAGQIRANIAGLEAEWRAAHPGAEPGVSVRRAWDQRAWAIGREAKDPALTAETLRDRAAGACVAVGVDPGCGQAGEHLLDTQPFPAEPEQIAAQAVEDLSATRSAWSAGQVHAAIDEQIRLSNWWGPAAGRVALHEAAAGIALAGCVSILPEEYETKALVQSKHLTTPGVLAAEAGLAAELVRLASAPGRAADVAGVAGAAGLDAGQTAAASLVAGSHGLAVVEGVAGAGKTRMLAAAQDVLAERGRALVVVTPTLKAAQVVRGEGIGRTSSVHKLLHRYGWRWDNHGRFMKLAAGDIDPRTGMPWLGVREEHRLTAGSVIVVDEAGMIDVPTATALIDVANQTGAAVRLVGDRGQLAAVGRGGVMDAAIRYAGPGRVAQLATARRFRRWDAHRGEWAENRAYADVAAQIRRRENSGGTFAAMRGGVGGSAGIVRADDLAAAYRLAAGQAAAGRLVIAPTNADVAEINTVARGLLVEAGRVDDSRVAATADGCRVGAGDVIVTRRNDPDVGVANREVFTVAAVRADGGLTARPVADLSRLVILPAGYVAGQTDGGVALVQHAYATTGHGAQGQTVDRAVVLVTDRSDAAGLYVGVTRGRLHNQVIIPAASDREAARLWTQAATRARADAGVDAARDAAIAEIRREQGQPAGPGPQAPRPLTTAEVGKARGIIDTRIVPSLRLIEQWAAYRQSLKDHDREKAALIKRYGDPAVLRGKAAQALRVAGETQDRIDRQRQDRAETASADAGRRAEKALGQVKVAHSRVVAAGVLHRRQARRGLQEAIDQAVALAPAVTPPADWQDYRHTSRWRGQIIDQAATTAARPTPSEGMSARIAARLKRQAEQHSEQANRAETALAAQGDGPTPPPRGARYGTQDLAGLADTARQLQDLADRLNPTTAGPDTVRETLTDIAEMQAEQQAARKAAAAEREAAAAAKTARNARIQERNQKIQDDYLARTRRNNPPAPSRDRGPSIGF